MKHAFERYEIGSIVYNPYKEFYKYGIVSKVTSPDIFVYIFRSLEKAKTTDGRAIADAYLVTWNIDLLINTEEFNGLILLEHL